MELMRGRKTPHDKTSGGEGTLKDAGQRTLYPSISMCNLSGGWGSVPYGLHLSPHAKPSKMVVQTRISKKLFNDSGKGN
jgi:hypothetical protein